MQKMVALGFKLKTVLMVKSLKSLNTHNGRIEMKEKRINIYGIRQAQKTVRFLILRKLRKYL